MSFNWREISTENELNEVLSGTSDSAQKFPLILKHSKRCVLSGMAKNRLERNADQRISYYIIDVISNRAVSNLLSEKTGVKHESPQMFLFSGSNLISVKSHMAIDSSEVTTRLDSLIRI